MRRIVESIVQEQPTAALRRSPAKAFRAKYDPSDLTEAMYSAARASKRDDREYWVYPGNSYGSFCYRIGSQSDALSTVNCNGGTVYSVSPDFSVTLHRLEEYLRPVS